mmetsp:Transcript_42542/g.99805  ORF Transcript_42542/g.99805 Transcript_42542/m.99805 type:complete len:426 (-) Transcript_42542:126-1403(-)
MPEQVKLYWKLALREPCPLRDLAAMLPPAHRHLTEVDDLHITLLFYGGRSDEKAAAKNGMPVSHFLDIASRLQALNGNSFTVHANTIFFHKEVVYATVSLPGNLPCPDDTPYVKFLIQADASGSIVRELRDLGAVPFKEYTPLVPVPLEGVVGLELADPLPCQIRREREQRVPDEAVGMLVQVKKHSSMSCAVVTFPSPVTRDAILMSSTKRLDKLNMLINGVPVDIKPHTEKCQDGGRLPVADAIFVGWKKNSGTLDAADLQHFFDREAEKHCERVFHDAQSQIPSAEAACLLKLKRQAKSQQVLHVLQDSPLMAGIHQKVQTHGHEVSPAWANGARIYMRVTREQVDDAGIVLDGSCIICEQEDAETIKTALREGISCRQRPKVHASEIILQVSGQSMPEEVVEEVCRFSLATGSHVECASLA